MTILLIIWTATLVGLGFAVLITPGISIKNLSAFIIAAVALGLINSFIRPLLWFLTAPLSALTFGLFTLVINALMIMFAASLVPGFEVKNFGSALLGAFIMALVGVIGFVVIALLSGGDINWHYEYHSQTFPVESK